MTNDHAKFSGMDEAEMPSHAVSLYDQNATEEFPVLKAFQQYIDAEQAKARKRLISLGIFFGILMGAVIAVFVGMLLNISQRNQALNDRLIEFAMKERDRQAPVVVQSPLQQDNAAVLALTARLEEMQKKLMDSQKQVQDAQASARKAAEAAKGPSAEELEIQRLKALLAAEKEKAAEKAAEAKKMKREQELEAYRRKHYPELYAPKPVVKEVKPVVPRKPTEKEIQEIFDEIDGKPEVVDTKKTAPAKNPAKDAAKDAAKKTVVSEGSAISYFDDDEKDAPKPGAKPAESYVIPVDIKGTTSQWQIPQ